MQRCDFIILGGGPAGYRAAELAAEGGMSVTLLEEKHLGGTCLNEGCIPTKTLLHSAKLFHAATHSEAFGVKVQGAAFDHAAVLARKNKVVKSLVAGVNSRMKAGKVGVIPHRGVIAGKEPQGIIVKAGGEAYGAPRLLIATGSRAALPPVPGIREGLEDGFVLTSREALSLPALPETLAIIGGGIVGLELACYFSAVGCKVVVVEMLRQIAGPMDNELSVILQKNLEQQGVAFRLGTAVSRVTPRGVELAGGEVIPAEKIILCAGRVPATEGAGLEELGVYMEKGAVVTDRHLQTSVSGVYAAGDVNGRMMLAHAAYREAEVAMNHMLGVPDSMRYEAVPSVLYTFPEAAWVGETEESARAKGFAARAVRVPMRYSGRYQAETERGDGLCKLVAEQGSGRLLGAHLIGSYASELILSAAMMVESHWPARALQKLVFPHPTVGEVIKEALFMLDE